MTVWDVFTGITFLAGMTALAVLAGMIFFDWNDCF
jgi:hypothetical protein